MPIEVKLPELGENVTSGQVVRVLVAVGDTIVSGKGADVRTGNALPLREVPLGTAVHNVELKVGRGGQICRSAGCYAQLMAKEGEYVLLRLPSGELRQVLGRCRATGSHCIGAAFQRGSNSNPSGTASKASRRRETGP